MLSPPKDSHQGKTPWHTRGKPIRLHNGDLEWMPSMQNVLLSSVPQPGPLINPSRTMPGVMFITTSRGLPGMGQGLQTRGCSEFCCPKCSHLVPAFLGFRESSLCVVISLGVCQGRPRQPVLSVVATTTPPPNTIAASSNQQKGASVWRLEVHTCGVPKVVTSLFGL